MIAVTSRKAIRNPASICGSSYAANGYRGEIFSFFLEGGGGEVEAEGVEKKPPGAMNDIIEFHAAPIPVSMIALDPRNGMRLGTLKFDSLRL